MFPGGIERDQQHEMSYFSVFICNFEQVFVGWECINVVEDYIVIVFDNAIILLLGTIGLRLLID